LYYISPEAQVEQLRSTGFLCNEIFTATGDELRPGTREQNPSPWLYYLARKPGTGDSRSSAECSQSSKHERKRPPSN
jgi:hypothetical protein